MKLTQAEVIVTLEGERRYQDKKWLGHEHSPLEYLVFIEDYVNEAKHLASRKDDPEATEKVMDNMRKIGALAVAAMEEHGTNYRE